jgi:hypothetical protein
VAVRKALSSLTGLLCKPGAEPSHKWLGYFQKLFQSDNPEQKHRLNDLQQTPEAAAGENQQSAADSVESLANFRPHLRDVAGLVGDFRCRNGVRPLLPAAKAAG